MSNSGNTIFRVHFQTDDNSYSLLARLVREAEFLGFIEIGEIIFEDHDRLIVSPEDEALRKEFARIDKIMVPHQYIRRIDQLSDDDDIGVSYLKVAPPKTN